MKENKNNMLLLAGIIISIAGGIRYESWFISFLIFVLIAYCKMPRKAFLFAVFAAIIPVYWLLSNYFYADNALNSFGWAINLPESNSINSLDSLLRRIWVSFVVDVCIWSHCILLFYKRAEIIQINSRKTNYNRSFFIVFYNLVVILISKDFHILHT